MWYSLNYAREKIDLLLPSSLPLLLLILLGCLEVCGCSRHALLVVSLNKSVILGHSGRRNWAVWRDFMQTS